MCNCTPSRSVCMCQEPKEEHKCFDPTKPVQTRDGRKARILITDLQNQTPIVAAITSECDVENAYHYGIKGNFCDMDIEHRYDLVNIPQKRWVSLNRTTDLKKVYVGGLYKTKQDADSWASETRIACFEIDWPE